MGSVGRITQAPFVVNFQTLGDFLQKTAPCSVNENCDFPGKKLSGTDHAL